MFLLSILNSEPQLDAMPVIKTTCYPWTIDSYKPLAYARCAVVDCEGILFDLQAFDRDPDCSDKQDLLNNHCVAVSFQFNETLHDLFTIVLNADGAYRAYVNAQPITLSLDVTTYAGDDEQGWYWGVRFYIPEIFLKQTFCVAKIQHGHKMKGNIYKFKRTGADSHLGAAAHMENDSIFSTKNLDDFVAVSY